MELKLNKPIIFFDLETTGINIAKDKIVEISILKIYPNGNKESKTWLVNPEMQIPKEASDIHGITNERVVAEPTFKELAKEVRKMIEGCDLAGFNSNRFDIPLLAEHFLAIICEDQGLPLKEIDGSGITALKNVNWTGNIRELRNIIERLVILCGDTIVGNDVNLYANPKG